MFDHSRASRSRGRARPFWRAVAIAALVPALGACGGHSGGGKSSPAPSPTDLLVTQVLSDGATGRSTVLVLDPAAPTPPRASIALSGTENSVTQMDYDIDTVSGRYTLYGDSVLFHVKGGQVFRTSLRKADATTPQRISSLATACSLVDSSLGWVTVHEAGADGQCATTADNRVVHIRSDAATSTPAVALPDGVELVEALPNPDFRTALFHIARDTRGAQPKYVLYTPELAPAGDVAGSTGASDLVLKLMPGPLQGRAWAYDGAAMRTIAWSAAGASLGAPVYTFGQPPAGGSAEFLSDGDALYFVDGPKLVRIADGSASTLASFDATDGPIELGMLKSAESLVLRQSGTPSSSLWRVDKKGGAPVRLATGDSLYPIGLRGGNLEYVSYQWSTVGGTTTSLHRIGLDGSHPVTLVQQADSYLQWISPRTLSLDQITVDGVLWCERAAGESNCRNGTVKSLDLRTDALRVLGVVSPAGLASDYVSWNPLSGSLSLFLTFDNPGLLRSSSLAKNGTAYAYTDLYTARPGVAGSLAHVDIAAAP